VDMKRGTFFYNKQNNRMDISFGSDKTYGGLHCGEVFKVLIKGKYQTVRIEFGSGWYLIANDGNICEEDMIGMRVRV